MAASTSLLSPDATVANPSAVAGSIASNVAADLDQVRCPAMNIRPSTVFVCTPLAYG